MFDHYSARGGGADDFASMAKPRIFLSRPSEIYQRYVKRALDILCILLSLPFLLPILVVVAICTAMDGHSPLYSQDRIGRQGRVFKMWKFRTMVPNAEAKLQEMIAADPKLASEWHAHQKLKCDARITAIGQLLRKTSIDELPQLWNVLTGDMSLVGPRPMMTDQKELYPGRAYFDMRPGLTGMWQISDRNDCTFAERASFDTAYYQRMSLATDCKILASTVGVVMRGTGY